MSNSPGINISSVFFRRLVANTIPNVMAIYRREPPALQLSGVTSYGALGHVPPPLELVQVVIFTLHVCSVAFPVHVKLVT